MSVTETVRAYLKSVGPSFAASVTRDTGIERHRVARALCDMVQDGTVSKRPGRPVLYTYVRDPMPVAVRAQVATRAAEAYRATVRLTPEQRRAKDSARFRAYYQRKKGERAEAPKEPRKAKAPAQRIRRPKPQAVPVTVLPKPKRKPSPASAAIVDKLARNRSPQIAPVQDGLPDTEAWLRENADRLIRLEPGASSQPKERLTAAQRRMVINLEVAA